MADILQVDFPFAGPFGPDRAAGPGLIWEIRPQSPETARAGGCHLLQTAAKAKTHAPTPIARLGASGTTGVHAQQFHITADLPVLNRFAVAGPLPSA